MKISNESKIGVLAAVSITLLILGFNFLKGKTLFENHKRVYAVFNKIEGLSTSNMVTINGLQVGKVANMHERDKKVSAIILAIDLTKEVNIPDNSLIFIDNQLFKEARLNIKMGNSTHYIKDGDTLQSTTNPNVLENFQQSINPAINNVNSATQALELLINNINAIFDPNTKNNLRTLVANSSAAMASVKNMLNSETGELAKSLNNLNTFTDNLNRNNEKINKTIDNLQQATAKLSNSNIDSVIRNLQKTSNSLNQFSTKLNSKDGSLGLLINDRTLYNNLENSIRSMNTLLDDIRVNPKRYVNISLIGRKNKGGYLEAPLNDSTKKK